MVSSLLSSRGTGRKSQPDGHPANQDLYQEVVHLQADIITTEGTTFTRTLHQGWTYGIAAFGDWRIKDLDITVYMDVDGEWIEVMSDDESDNHP